MVKAIAIVLLAAYLALLFDLTLVRYQTAHASPNFLPFHTIDHDFHVGGAEFRVNILGNLAAFAPLGWLAAVLMGQRASTRRIAALSFALSLLIESIQGYSGHRVADVDDLLLNTIGGLIGYGFWKGGRWLRRRVVGMGPEPVFSVARGEIDGKAGRHS